MSNLKLVAILVVMLLLLVAGAVQQCIVEGHVVGFGVGLYLLPIMIICSLLIGIACGLRGPR